MNEQGKPVSAAFIRELTRVQLDLRLYIVALVGNPHDAADVLQETNMDLWKKAETYDPARPFLPWAKALAWYQVLKFRTYRKRDRLLFSDALLEVLAERLAVSQGDAGAEHLLEVLDGCMAKLTERQREYLSAKYALKKKVDQMALEFNQSVMAVTAFLYRIRMLLNGCMRKRMSVEPI